MSPRKAVGNPAPAQVPPLRPGLGPLPRGAASLPRDARGYPVPWFVQWFTDGEPGEPGVGVPDFRVVDSRKLVAAVRGRLCWFCGRPMGAYLAFVVGPMCGVNRTSSEPPCHRTCAEFSARVCPFLSRPKAQRREANLPEGNLSHPAAIPRNPGVTLVWITYGYRVIKQERGAVPLFTMGDPIEALWYAEGRAATRAEVEASIESGLPFLLEAAHQDGDEAIAELERRRVALQALLPGRRL